MIFDLVALQNYILNYGARFLRIKFHDEVDESHQAKKCQPPAMKGIEPLRDVDDMFPYETYMYTIFLGVMQ